MNFFFLHTPEKKQIAEQEKYPSITMNEPLHNRTEGSEFLDDAIRMIEQPLMFTEACIAPGSPKELW